MFREGIIIQTKSFKNITIGLTLGMMVLFIITFINATGDIKNGIVIDRFDNITIYRSDGRTDVYNDNLFEKSEKGDVIHAEFTLPDKPGAGHYSLFSNDFNCIVTISYENEILFTYGKSMYDKGRQSGHFIICADIPDYAWGKTITAEFQNMDYSQPHSLNPFEILPTLDKAKYIFSGSAIPYFVSIMFGVLCFIIIIPLLLWNAKGQHKTEMVVLMAFCLHTTMWSIGYQKMAFLTYDNNMFICDMEYIGIFGIPAFFSIFMTMIGTGKIYRKIMTVIAVSSTVYYVVATVLNYTTRTWHYCRMLTPVHVFIGVGVLVMFIHFIREKNIKNYQARSLRTGSIVFLMFIMADFIVYFMKVIGFVTVDVVFVPFGLFSFLLIIFMSYLLYLVEFMVEANDKERLHKMAYTDGMTGVSNRRACLEYLKELGDSKEDYGIVFFDVNNLKTANDKYSHDVGDKLICTSASAISESFGEDCFCGRYGGDEFIACIKGNRISEDDINERLKAFQLKLDEINSKGEFPFKVTVAYGFAISSLSPALSADEIIGLADKNMYDNKEKMKKSLS